MLVMSPQSQMIGQMSRSRYLAQSRSLRAGRSSVADTSLSRQRESTPFPPSTPTPPPPRPMPPKTTGTAIYIGGPRKVASSFVLGQGFESSSFDAERRRVNREWVEHCEGVHRLALVPADQSTVRESGVQPNYILSKAAKAIIERDNGEATDAEPGRREPAFMRPSTKPGDYSKVSCPDLHTWVNRTTEYTLLVVCSGAHTAKTSVRTSCCARDAGLASVSTRQTRQGGVQSGLNPSRMTRVSSSTVHPVVKGWAGVVRFVFQHSSSG